MQEQRTLISLATSWTKTGVKFVAMWCPKVAQLLLAEKDSDTEEGGMSVVGDLY